MNATQLSQFEAFWSSYPRRVGKGAARKAFEKAMKLATFDEVMNGLRRQISYYATREHQFIPHPSTWLNQERWCDEPQPVQSYNRTRQSNDMADFASDLLGQAHERASKTINH